MQIFRKKNSLTFIKNPLSPFRWFKHISDAAEAYKCREGKSRRSELSTPELSTPESEADTSPDLPAGGDADKTELVIGGELPADAVSSADTDSGATSGENSQRNSGVIEDDSDKGTPSEADSQSGTGNYWLIACGGFIINRGLGDKPNSTFFIIAIYGGVKCISKRE